MTKFKRLTSLVLTLCLVCCMTVSASADSTIDPGRTGSLTLYKYDLTSAEADGVWDSSAYVATGESDQGVIDALAGYAVPGVEFSCIKLAEAESDKTGEDISTLYAFSDRAFLEAIGISDEENKLSSDELNAAMTLALSANATNTKNKLEALVKSGGTAMPLTDEYGKTAASNLPLGLYLVVETKVPENVTSTCNPFLVSIPSTSADGTAWNYDITVYPKAHTGMPTLEKSVRAAGAQSFAASATASAGEAVEYQIISTLPTITSDATTLSRYSFRDNLASGISYNKGDVSVRIYKDKACTELVSTWDESSGKFTVNYTDHSMSIDMSESGLAEINGAAAVYGADSLNLGCSDCTMKISYGCTLLSGTALVCGDAGNLNTVQLTWARTNTDKTDSLTDHAHIYAYALDLSKKFSDGKGDLSKVRFLIQNDTDKKYIKAKQMDGLYYVTGSVADKSAATAFIPTANGKIQIRGLAAGEYTALETATDSAYNPLKGGAKISISTAEDEACNVCGKKTMSAKATVNNKAVTMSEGNAAVPMTVVNTKGFELPQTGSYGTWIFPVCGIIVMGAAVFAIYKIYKQDE